MNLLAKLFPPRPTPNPARELALIGVKKRQDVRRAMVCAVAQRMRRELGMPEHEALK